MRDPLLVRFASKQRILEPAELERILAKHQSSSRGFVNSSRLWWHKLNTERRKKEKRIQ